MNNCVGNIEELSLNPGDRFNNGTAHVPRQIMHTIRCNNAASLPFFIESTSLPDTMRMTNTIITAKGTLRSITWLQKLLVQVKTMDRCSSSFPILFISNIVANDHARMAKQIEKSNSYGYNLQSKVGFEKLSNLLCQGKRWKRIPSYWTFSPFHPLCVSMIQGRVGTTR